MDEIQAKVIQRVQMAKQNEHGKLIAAAAKAALLPLGFCRIGQSRCWYSDERFWRIFVEFQPSQWWKGTYLNVSPRWFFVLPEMEWFPHRVGDYIEFKSVNQFAPLIKEGADRVAARVIDLREKFATLPKIHRFFAENVAQVGNTYRAAVTAGLVGDLILARRLFAQIKEVDLTRGASRLDRDIQDECFKLDGLLDRPAAYRSAVLDRITDRRQKSGLPPDLGCLESMALPKLSEIRTYTLH